MKLFKKEFFNKKYEKTEDGEIFLPKSNVFIGGIFNHWVNNDLDDIQSDKNMVVNEGLDHLLDVTLSGGSAKPTWYIGINKNNYTFLNTDTAQNISTNSSEVVSGTDVTQTVRQVWNEAGVTSQSITNSANPASYTANATVTIYGAFLISFSTMTNGTSSDKLMAASAFTSSRALVANDVLNITYELNISDAS